MSFRVSNRIHSIMMPYYLFVFLAISVLPIIATGVESTKLGKQEEPLLAYLVESGVIDHDMADLLRINCKHELSHATKTLQDGDLHFLEKRSINELTNVRTSSREMHDTMSVLLPEVNKILVNCVRGRNVMVPDNGEENGSDAWYTRCLEFIFNHHPSSRRRELAGTFGEAPAPSPISLSPSPAPAVSPSPTPVPASPPLIPFFPQDSNNSNSQPTASVQPSDLQSRNDRTHKRTVIIAVVVTASVTFLFAALLFFFCCGPRSKLRANDQRPLLSLSLSDYSIAAYNMGTIANEEKPGNQSSNNKPNNNKVSGKFNSESHSVSNSKVEARVGNNVASDTNSVGTSLHMPPKQTSLKPPPGRTDSPKPPSVNAAPPPPALPRRPSAGPRTHPPPPMDPFSGGSRPPPPGPPLPPPIPSGLKTGARPPPPGPPVPPPIPSGLKTGAQPPPPGPPPPPPIPSGLKTGARPPPPPPPGGGVPPPRPPPPGLKPPRPLAPGPRNPSTSSSIEESEAGNPKTKLKPFFWDKVLANPDHSMVWHQIKSGSFQFNEEEIETLFGFAPAQKNKNETNNASSSHDVPIQRIQLIDPKKAQNLSILLKALNVTTEEVCDALVEGNELPPDLIQTLLKMAPTTDEELKLRLYTGDLAQLGTAERFLKVLVDIPFAFKRLESLLYMCTLQEETSTLKVSFAILEAACTELRKSRLFLKLLEAVLKTGNRMNDGTFRGGAQAFKLDTLLKLSDVKGTDGKTTLLHFVVQEITRSEGVRAARAAKETRSLSSFKSVDLQEDSDEDSDDHLRAIGLEVISGVGNELENVRKAANLDADSLTGTVAKLGHGLVKSRDFLNSDMKNIEQKNGFHLALESFVQNAEVDVTWALEEEKRIMALVKSTGDYFHGNSGKDEGLRLFVIVRDFLIILDKVCREVKNVLKKSTKTSTAAASTAAASTATVSTAAETPPDPKKTSTPVDLREKLFPAIADRRIDNSSSDDET